MIFDYYYGTEVEQHIFYRMPRAIMQDEYFKELSNDAKLLYMLMFNRLSLSLKNGWYDENRAFIIYSIEEICQDLNCKRDKAIKTVKELDVESGIGLIKKRRQGLNRANMFFVMNFTIMEEQPDFTEDNVENFPSKSALQAEVDKTDYRKSEISTLGSLRYRLQKVDCSDSNKIEKSKINKSNNPIVPFCDTGGVRKTPPEDLPEGKKGMDNKKAYEEIVKENIEYETLIFDYPTRREVIDGIVNIISDIAAFPRETVKVNSQDMPYELVKSKLLKITMTGVQHVLDSLNKNATEIRSIRNYMITALYNVNDTMSTQIGCQVNHDFYGRDW